MDIRITPAPLGGTVSAPPSKSAAHRAVIAAALCKTKTSVCGVGFNDDIIATLNAVKALGAKVEIKGGAALIDGIRAPADNAVIDCGESGSTLRFLIPVAAAFGVNATFRGRGRLPERPITVFTDCLTKKGVTFNYNGTMPFSVSGRLKSGVFEVDGSVSSQFVTGLLFALPIIEGDSEIVFTSPLQSKPYADMTVSVLGDFGVEISETERGYFVKGGQQYRFENEYFVEGDYSGAAFMLCAGALGKSVECKGLRLDSLQGDRAVLDILKAMNAEVKQSETVTVSGQRLKAVKVNAQNIPDLVPVIAATAACAEGVTVITGAQRLRIKESDRLKTTTEMLNALGAGVAETEDGLIINGKQTLSGGITQSYGDHRIAMAAAVAATRCKGGVIIRGAECVSKSYPDFFEDYKRLGGKADVIDMGQRD